METLSEAKQFVQDNMDKGCVCPTCDQFVKVYKYKINSTMAYGLLMIAKSINTDTTEWFHLERYFKPLDVIVGITGNLPKMRYWGFIERLEGEREDGSKRVGMYRLTERGKEFARNELSVPNRAVMHNNKLLGLTGDLTNMQECLERDNRFSYRELMAE